MTAFQPDRRRLLKAGAWLLGGAMLPGAARESGDRILVVLELSGGNDGLNCVVPHGDDAYYRLRPNIAIRRETLLPLDSHFGLNPGMTGMHRLWQDGRLAIVHGCGYDHPSFSHFTSMAYWHTASPNSGNSLGWAGRLADAMQPEPASNFIINIGASQSLAVVSRYHSPVVFDDPARFERRGYAAVREVMSAPLPEAEEGSPRAWLRDIARSAQDGAAAIRAACAEYRTPVDYGIAPLDLDKVAACINAKLPTRIYYVSFRNNAFDTHVHQREQHQRLLTYASDAVYGFLRDMERIGAADRVVLMAFSEFGRRVPENANLGTDHGAAGPMFIAGAGVKAGHYGEWPDLVRLDDGENLPATTDFRRVYATVIDGFVAPGKSAEVLGGRHEVLPVFG